MCRSKNTVSQWASTSLWQKLWFFVTVLLIAVIGTILLVASHAATPAVSLEPESGTLNAVSPIADSLASNGKAVRFGVGATPTPTPPPPPSTGFTHPGILVNKQDLDFVKGKIAAGSEPWAGLYAKMKGSSLAAVTYAASPLSNLDCGASVASCESFMNDTQAAYIDSLLWYYSGNNTYAQKSIDIMNKWSATLNTTSTTSNSPLFSAWAAEVFPRAAEIIRYTYTPPSGQAGLNVTAFSTMLNNALLPRLASGTAAMASSNGNWDLSMTEGLMNIGIFEDNKGLFDQGVARWQARTPAYVYLSSDNNKTGIPIAPPGDKYNSAKQIQCFWLNSQAPSTSCDSSQFFVENGQSQETCRDFNHVALGLSSLFNGAETAHIQGVDLYGQQKSRLMAGLEANTAIINARTYPTAICLGTVTGKADKNINTYSTYVIGGNEFANRQGLSSQMTATNKAVQGVEAGQTYSGPANRMMVWEALTHYQVP
jgi:hypothetical protein